MCFGHHVFIDDVHVGDCQGNQSGNNQLRLTLLKTCSKEKKKHKRAVFTFILTHTRARSVHFIKTSDCPPRGCLQDSCPVLVCTCKLGWSVMWKKFSGSFLNLVLWIFTCVLLTAALQLRHHGVGVEGELPLLQRCQFNLPDVKGRCRCRDMDVFQKHTEGKNKVEKPRKDSHYLLKLKVLSLSWKFCHNRDINNIYLYSEVKYDNRVFVF